MIKKIFDKTFFVKHPLYLTLSFVGIALLIFAGFLSGGIARLTKYNQENLVKLSQVLPDFSDKTLGEFKQEITSQEARVLALSYLFDPPQKEMEKDYDLPIYFVEELDKANQFLKLKAANKQIKYPDLGFKKTLPEEKEARYLLRQLYSLKEVAGKGMDCGINFTSITPVPIENLNILSDVKIAKARVEFIASAVGLIEFFVQLSEAVPLISVESFLLKSEGFNFKVDMIISYTVIEGGWKNKRIPFNPLNIKDIFSEEEKFTNILRGNNPFFVAGLEGPSALPAQEQTQQLKQLPRFLYRGKAVLKSKEVAVVEDTLNRETVFLALEDKIGDFILKELKESQIILENITNAQKIIINREEK